ncbi:uncharacterized protein METZ01_LOCUS438956, partial [marine metagenome]
MKPKDGPNLGQNTMTDVSLFKSKIRHTFVASSSYDAEVSIWPATLPIG